MRWLVMAIALVVGCGKNLSPGEQFALDMATRDLDQVEKHMGDDPFDLCVSVEQANQTLAKEHGPAVSRILGEGQRVCAHDAPLAFGKTLVARLESPTSMPFNPADPNAAANETNDHCVDLELVLNKLAPYASEPDVQTLKSKREALCK